MINILPRTPRGRGARRTVACLMATNAVPVCNVTNEQVKEELRGWERGQGRPLVIVAVGKGGVGKSTLVNNFLELKESDEQWCEEGDLPSSTTKVVKKCIVKKDEVVVHVVDTPGLGASIDDIHPKKVIQKLSEVTDKKADILFYCVSLHPGSRFDKTDVNIVKMLTTAYGPEIWARTLLILTFANQSKPVGYVERIEGYAAKFAEILKMAKVNIPVKAVLHIQGQTSVHNTQPQAQAPPPSATQEEPPPSATQTTDQVLPQNAVEQQNHSIPAIPVGNEEMKLPSNPNWSENLLLEVLKKAQEPQTVTNILTLKGFEIKVEEVFGGACGGTAVGGAVGGAVGAAFGGVGVIIGAPIGAGVGGLSGTIIAVSKAKLLAFQRTNF